MPHFRTFTGLLLLAVALGALAISGSLPAQEKKSLRSRLKQAFKGQPAWTLDEAMAQLRLCPKDAYLQYVALQLARRENRLNDIGREIEGLLGQTPWQEREERARQVDLFSIFTGALAVQESLQLDAMHGAGGRPTDPNSPIAPPAGLNPGAPRNAAAQQAALEQRRKERVAVRDLSGPTIKSHPWEQMLSGKKPKISASPSACLGISTLHNSTP